MKNLKSIYPFVPILGLWLVKDENDPDYHLDNPWIFWLSIIPHPLGGIFIGQFIGFLVKCVL